MKDPNDWGYPITDTDTGKVYSCASNIWMKELCTDINKIVDENEQLKYQNEMLSDELEQCKAVVEKRWSEYLQKKELENG